MPVALLCSRSVCSSTVYSVYIYIYSNGIEYRAYNMQLIQQPAETVLSLFQFHGQVEWIMTCPILQLGAGPGV